ncbi:HNH endonuclease [Arthrobacter phage Jasmine]|uniref:HNH endonuclease n=1 Tax=Arthrobacter phage Jasmine TaxID=1772302 RepID=A0A0U4B3J6_9CAUD|nr:HNH endonuclease [Arthrobacter phage Jasmine]ALY09325.1 HNH endonuclease [Arthrobacter phage Jasmine]
MSTNQEYRTIPEFPIYEITSDGDVRHREKRTILKEIENKVTGAWFYSLHKKDEKRRYSRHYQGLIYQAWPELLAGWKSVDGFPNYLINDKGDVMQTRWYNVLPTKNGAVRLFRDGKRFTFHPQDYLKARKE